MQEIHLPLTEIRAVGGGARSPLWRQIKADVTGLPDVALNTVEATALGAGILTLSGAGFVESLAEAVEMTMEVVERRDPEPSFQAKYEEYYHIPGSIFRTAARL
jgi:xylulokinase